MSIRTRFIAALLVAASTLPAGAQAPRARGGTPSFTPVEVSADGTITFRMYAPAAKSVELRGEAVTVSGRDAIPMTKDEQGVWSATLSGLPPELYSYAYVVDGAPVAD